MSASLENVGAAEESYWLQSFFDSAIKKFLKATHFHPFHTHFSLISEMGEMENPILRVIWIRKKVTRKIIERNVDVKKLRVTWR